MDTVVPNILEVLRHFDKTRAKGENANIKAIYAICNLCIFAFPSVLTPQQPERNQTQHQT